VFRDVVDVGLVARRRDNTLDPGLLSSERLLLQAADRQHLADQGDLAGHGRVGTGEPAGDQRCQGGCHRDPGAGAVFRNRARRHVHVHVVLREPILLSIEVALGPRKGRGR